MITAFTASLIAASSLLHSIATATAPAYQQRAATDATRISTTACQDVHDWTDQGGHGCDWYGVQFESDAEDYPGVSRCESYGNCCENDMLTGIVACCICGGGFQEDFPPQNDEQKKLDNTEEHNSFEPETCTDETDFKDCNGFDCAWYSAFRDDDFYNLFYDDADTRCFMWGNCPHVVTGKTANEACCECGGGSAVVEMSPSGTPVRVSNAAMPSFDASSMRNDEHTTSIML